MRWNTVKEEARSFAQIAVILVIFLLVLDAKIGALKADINTVVRVQCLSGNANSALSKYDDAIQVLIEQANKAQKINLAAGRTKLAILNAATASRLEADKIAIVQQDCSKPLLQ